MAGFAPRAGRPLRRMHGRGARCFGRQRSACVAPPPSLVAVPS